MAGSAAAYAARLTSLHSDKEDRAKRLAEAKDKHASWLKEKRELAEQTARDHERKRLEATHEYETQNTFEELERQNRKKNSKEKKKKRPKKEKDKPRLKLKSVKERKRGS